MSSTKQDIENFVIDNDEIIVKRNYNNYKIIIYRFIILFKLWKSIAKNMHLLFKIDLS